MTGDYPDDIIAAANAVVDRGYNEGLVDAICKALLAERLSATERERERCRAIAYQKTAQLPRNSDFTRGYTEGRIAVAVEIRQP